MQHQVEGTFPRTTAWRLHKELRDVCRQEHSRMATTICAVHLRTHPQHILQNSMLSLVLLHNSSRSKSWYVSKEFRVIFTTITIWKRRKSYPVIVGLIQLNSADYLYLYRCTVHSVVYLINTPTNAHIII